MRVVQSLLVFLLLFLVVIGTVFLIEAPIGISSRIHDEFPTMLQSGDINYGSSFAILSYLFGFGVIGTLCFFVFIGAYKNGKLGAIRIGLSIGAILYLIVYSILFMSYLSYANPNSEVQFVGGWPAPTAWMMYGMWATPLIFVMLYSFKFRDWILSEEDEKRFQELKAKRKERIAQ